MSIGNLKDQGNKGNNFPYQIKTLQLLGAINDSIAALPGVDYETRTTTYQATCTVCGTGYSTGDIIVRYDIIDVATSSLSATVWFNQTLQTTLPLAPLPGDLTPISAPSGVTVLGGTLTGITNTVNVNQVEKTGVSGLTTAITGVAATDVIVAPGAGLFNYITQILVTNSDATAGTVVTLQDDTGFPIYSGYAGPAGGGFSVSLPTPIKMPSANTKLQAICSIAANVYVSASGYKAA